MNRAVLLSAGLAMTMIAGLLGTACGGGGDGELIVYVGRSQVLVGPLLDQFAEDTGTDIRVLYGDGTELALGILSEGENTPADLYLTQDVGALGALKAEDRLQALPQEILDRVDPAFRSPDGLWVGLSGRARVIGYNTDAIDPATLPDSILDYTDKSWEGRLGIVPRSDGFPEFVTALRLTRGDDFARQWLTDLKRNSPVVYPNNTSMILALNNGEIDVAFLNHYYLYRFLEERGEGFKVRNYYFENGDIGGIFLVSGAAILDTAKHREAAEAFIAYLLTDESQAYFANETHEYPLVEGVAADVGLPDLSQSKHPDIDLSDLTDLVTSLDLMRDAGILP